MSGRTSHGRLARGLAVALCVLLLLGAPGVAPTLLSGFAPAEAASQLAGIEIVRERWPGEPERTRTPTATPSATVTPTAGRPLVGPTVVGPRADRFDAGQAEAFVSTAMRSGRLDALRVYVDRIDSDLDRNRDRDQAERWRLGFGRGDDRDDDRSPARRARLVAGLYADSGVGNRPGLLLTQGQLDRPDDHAWNIVPVPPVAIVAGRRYWIALLSPEGREELWF